MHAVYKAVPLEDIQRIIEHCRDHMKNNGELFEVYPGQEDHMAMVIVNACSGEYAMLRPVGAFYCNFVGPGVISIEEEDPSFDGAESRTRHVQAIKQVIDILLKDGYPGNIISFNDLPAFEKN